MVALSEVKVKVVAPPKLSVADVVRVDSDEAVRVVWPVRVTAVAVKRALWVPPRVRAIWLAAGRYIPVVVLPVHEKAGAETVSAD